MSVVIGFVLENIGSLYEGFYLDKRLSKKYPDFKEVWHAYLAMRIKDEVVGHRYLQTIRLRLKFELSIAPALVFFSFGLLWLNRLDHFWPWWPTFTVFALSTVVVLVYILYEAYRSADVLHEVREVLVRELPKQPSAPISARETGT